MQERPKITTPLRVWLLTSAVLMSSCFCCCLAEVVDLNRVAFIINSQPNKHHAAVAKATRDHLAQALRQEGGSNPKIFLTHEEGTPPDMHGAWTYYPSIVSLGTDYADDVDWFMFLEENTHVDVALLVKVLEPHKPADDDLFLGHALKDRSSVVIHHYDQPHLEFPHLGAGFVLSRKLVENFVHKFEEIKRDRKRFPTDFSIDPAYELAKTINHLHDSYDGISEPPEADEPGLALIHDRRLCYKKDVICATYPRKIACPKPDDLNAFANQTFFGVKTCKKFHAERLPVILDTWTKAVLNIKYFSEEADPEWQTSTLPGVKNTERGHCKKTMAIIEHFHGLASSHGYEWLVITDDDTILSAKKMLEHLACYDPEDNVVLGQRYGFRVSTGQYGYNYPTGGGGMAFSRAAAKAMLDRQDACACRTDDSPDDMHLGGCLTSMGVDMVHSDRFHQARPEDYHRSVLEEHDPVSFHKFWNTDPRKMYETWFKEHDTDLVAYKAALEAEAATAKKLAAKEEL